jgi:hypothetical protein
MNKFDVIGGLYWTKGENGIPMVYGTPDLQGDALHIPVIPEPNSLVECNGMGMGFTLFKLDIFKDARLERPFFKTDTSFDEETEIGRKTTQDIYFYKKARALGYKLAVDTRVKVGHYDSTKEVWW